MGPAKQPHSEGLVGLAQHVVRDRDIKTLRRFSVIENDCPRRSRIILTGSCRPVDRRIIDRKGPETSSRPHHTDGRKTDVFNNSERTDGELRVPGRFS